MSNLVFHIVGIGSYFSNSEWLRNHISKIMVVEDIDSLKLDFIRYLYGNDYYTKEINFSDEIKHLDKNKFQKYIDDFINKQTKPILFFGNNNYKINNKNKDLYYDLHSQYNYYKTENDRHIITYKILHFLDSAMDYKGYDIEEDIVIKNNKTFVKNFIKKFKKECSGKYIIKQSDKEKENYKKRGYKLMSDVEIYETILKILKNKDKIANKDYEQLTHHLSQPFYLSKSFNYF